MQTTLNTLCSASNVIAFIKASELSCFYLWSVSLAPEVWENSIHWGLGPGFEGPLFSRLGKGRDDGTLADDLMWVGGKTNV